MARFIDRGVAITFVVALACVMGITLAAATLQSAEEPANGAINPPVPEGFGQSQGGDSGVGSGYNASVGEDQQSQLTQFSLTTCIPFMTTPFGMLATALALVGALALINRRYGVSTAFLAGYALTPPTVIGYFAVTSCLTAGGGGGRRISNMLEQPGGGGLKAVPVDPMWVAGIFGVALVVAAVALFRSTDDEQAVTLPDEQNEEPEMSDFARAAGRAADRIEEHNADVDNSVYRAWHEMTALLDVASPETSTAGEFADAAVDFGLDEEDVSELTRLFEEVRYGDKDASVREDRAVDILRRFEAEYENAGADDGGESR